ncbi:MAG: hypothetical protein V4659_11930 [Pseudomonadota bacterium]
MTRALPLLIVTLAVVGCTRDQGQIPSLLPRDIEARSDAEPVREAAVASPDPALDAEIAGLIAARDKASSAFAAADRTATARLAAGANAAVGSDAWLDAQTALAALDEHRAALLGVLTDLEQLAIARAGEGKPGYPALEAARVDTDAEVDRVTALVAQRKATLPL